MGVTKYLHPDRPAEVSEIEQRLQRLLRHKKNGRWDLVGLGKWLDSEIDPIFEALERMELFLDEQFPMVEGDQHERITTARTERVAG